VTTNRGKSWTNVVKNVPGLPPAAWVSTIEAGHFSDATAYATFDLHTFGDMKPYVYRTTDFGATWSPVVDAASPVKGYAHVVKEDLVNKDLLYVGTEFGLWISIDGGKQWAQYKGGDFPCVAVRDIVVHPRDHDLVIATHGRGIWIIDDITPLRTLNSETLQKDAIFISAKPAVQQIPAGGGWAYGDATFSGPNPTDDATITYYQKRRHIFGDLKIEVLDEQGKSLGTIPSSKRRGLNRATWGMRLKAPKVPPAATAAFGAATGPRVLPGTYTIRMTKDKNVLTTKLNVIADPRSKHTLQDRKAQFQLAMKLHGMLTDMAYDVDKINGVRMALEQRASQLMKEDALANKLHQASQQVDELRKKIVATKEGGMITGEERLREFLANLYGSVVNYEGKPSQTQVERADALGKELADVVHEFDAWSAKELGGINVDLSAKKLDQITMMTRDEWDKKNATAK
jgi:hypothetical protein